MSNENIAVIGAGPLALITVLELQKYTNKITLIHPPQKTLEESKKPLFSSKFIQKDRGTKGNVYRKFHPSLEVLQKGTNFVESPSVGGLSNIWGGICFPHIEKVDCLKYINTNEKTEIYSYLISLLRISNTKSKIWQNFELQKYTENALCVPPSVARIGSKTWSATSQLHQLNGVKFIEGEVASIKKVQGLLASEIIRNNHKQIVSFDRIFVACGPIGDAKIILNTFPKNTSIEIKDSRIEYQLLLKRSKINRLENLMTPSKCVYFFKDKRSIESYVQIYPLSKQLIESLPLLRINRFSRNMVKFLSKYFQAAIIFYPEYLSRTFIIERNSTGFKSYPGKKLPSNKCINGNQKMSNLKFKSIGYKPIFLRIKNKPGSGVHSGAFLFKDKFNYGRVPGSKKNFANLHFVGSSSISQIPVGPITLSSLTNGIYIVRKVFKDLVK